MDTILESFRDTQHRQAAALAARSPILQVLRLDAERFVARFVASTLVADPGGQPRATEGFTVGFWLGDDYLRRVEAAQLITLLEPRHVFHPNVYEHLICLGAVAPGTPLVELIYRVYEVLTFQALTVRDDDALNRAACQWARNHPQRLPVDRRPLKGRSACEAPR